MFFGYSMNSRFAVMARNGLQSIAVLALAAGVGVWGAILLAPSPQAAPPALPAEAIRGDSVEPIAAWFGAGPAVRVQVASTGLIAAGPHSSAILAVDGGRPRAYKVGQVLAADLVLSEVRAASVVVTQAGQSVEVRLPERPPVSGIAPAPAAYGG